MDFLGITPAQCKSAFAAGDMAYYHGSGCSESAVNDQLIIAKKSELNTKTIVLISVGLVATGLIIYLATK